MTRRSAAVVVGSALGAAALAAAVFVGWLAFAPGPTHFAGGPVVALAAYAGPSPTGVPAALAGASLVTRGEYLARAADCAACHTAKGGAAYAGGRAFKLPFGTLYSPNITPDPATGIGLWSDAEFVRAVHRGIGRGGKPLYPAFPYAAYSLLTDADVLAIRAYLASLPPVRQVAPANTLRFPFNQRALMIVWGTLFNRDRRFEPHTARSAAWNRGAYLVEAAGHCADCHSPRNPLQAVDNRRKFSGGAAEGWTAYNITADRLTGVGAWRDDALAAYLSSGHAAGRGTAAGPMAEAIDLSLRHLDPADLRAMVTYLRTVPAIHSAKLPDHLAGPAPAAPNGFAGSSDGKRIFEGACASCHAWDGSGALTERASLTGSRAINDPSAVNVAQMILQGSGTPGGAGMPSFGAAYSDKEVAAVANYVTARFGAAPSQITPKAVARLRRLD